MDVAAAYFEVVILAPRFEAIVVECLAAPSLRAGHKYSMLGHMAGKKPNSITHGLLIKEEHLDKILARRKTWEIRGSNTSRRGRIALIQSGSGHVVGTCELVGVEGPLSLSKLRKNANRVGGRASSLHYRNTYAWILKNARRLRDPVPYRHPHGAIIWVKLNRRVVRRIEADQAGR